MRELTHKDPDAVLPPPRNPDLLVAENNLRVAVLAGVMADAYARRFVCGPCGAAFLSIPELDLHILAHHPEDVFDEATG